MPQSPTQAPQALIGLDLVFPSGLQQGFAAALATPLSIPAIAEASTPVAVMPAIAWL